MRNFWTSQAKRDVQTLFLKGNISPFSYYRMW